MLTPILRLTEAAEYLRVHPSTMYRLLKRRALPYFKIGGEYRFAQDALDKWRFSQDASVAGKVVLADAAADKAVRVAGARAVKAAQRNHA